MINGLISLIFGFQHTMDAQCQLHGEGHIRVIQIQAGDIGDPFKAIGECVTVDVKHFGGLWEIALMLEVGF